MFFYSLEQYIACKLQRIVLCNSTTVFILFAAEIFEKKPDIYKQVSFAMIVSLAHSESSTTSFDFPLDIELVWNRRQ